METFPALLALCVGISPVICEFPSQMPLTRSFVAFFDLRLDKRLNEQSRRRWFETPSRPLWRHWNVLSEKLSGSTISAIETMSYHYSDVIMSAMASQITGVSIVWSTAYSGADRRKHQNSTSLAFLRGIHRSPVDSPHKGPVTRKYFHLMTLSCYIGPFYNDYGKHFMMTQWRGNSFDNDSPLWGNPPVTSWLPSQRVRNLELWRFLCCQS